ncbi:MAG: hypothetical protein J5741_03150, partial [Bacteroidales bacterium]|nr:hypothetical protein [Bacteroidales bacterium]
MKKSLSFLSVLLFLTASVTMGQNYQVPNNTFEGSWIQDNTVPSGWHSFKDAAGNYAGTVNGTNYSSRETGHGTGYCCRMESHSVVGVKANGNITTGQIMVDALSTSSTSNRNITDKDNSEGHNGFYTFSGRPDSLKLWCKFYLPKKTNIWGQGVTRSFTASLKFHLHGNVEYYDHKDVNESTAQSGKIANVYGLMTSPSVNCASAQTTSWMAFSFPVKYWNGSSQITSPNLGNTSAPSYLLASFSTNETIGGGEAGDAIFVDDIWFVYNKKLSSLVVGSTTLTSAQINTLNNAAYTLANGNTSNTFPASTSASNYPTYEYTSSICEADLATISITATPQSGFATATVQDVATVSNPYTIIKVTHTDNSKYYFRIYFSNIVSVATPTITGSTTACDNGSVTLTASTTTSGASYRWYNSAGTQIGTSNTYTASYSNVNTQTNYTYTCKALKSGCYSSAASHSVTVNPQPTISISGNTSICSGASTTLTANGASSYTWSNNLGTATSVNVGAGGTYTVTGTYNGCSNQASVTVTAYEAPTVTISGPTTACSADAITLTATGASTYVWSNNMGSSSSVTPTISGDYTVIGTDSHNCKDTATHHLTINPTPTVGIDGTTAICSGDTTTLTATSDLLNTTYQWSNGSTSPSLEVSSGGTYTVTGALNGCSSSYTVTVTESSTPADPTVTPASRCGAGAVTLTASSNEGTILWYANETTQSESGTGTSFTTPNISASTTYYVEVHSDAGCKSSRVPVTATVNENSDNLVAEPVTSCGPTTVTLSATGSTNPLTWYSDAAGTQTLANTTVTVDETTTYYVASTDGNGCRSALKPLAVTIHEVPATPELSQTTYCKGSGNVSLNAGEGSFHWYQTVGGTDYGNPYTATSTGTYYVTSYNAYCESAPVAVSVVAMPAAPSANAVTLCAAGVATLSVNNPDNAMTYTWYSDAGHTTSVGTGATVDMTVGQDATYYVTAQTEGCESDVTAVAVTIRETIDAPSLSSP